MREKEIEEREREDNWLLLFPGYKRRRVYFLFQSGVMVISSPDSHSYKTKSKVERILFLGIILIICMLQKVVSQVTSNDGKLRFIQ